MFLIFILAFTSLSTWAGGFNPAAIDQTINQFNPQKIGVEVAIYKNGRLGSISKEFTAGAILILEQEHKLSVRYH